MKKPYKPTFIEQWVVNTFVSADIIYPSDLEPDRVARALGIDYSVWPGITCSYRDARGNMFIMENSNTYGTGFRDQFFHELGHVIRDSGDQLSMPKLYRESQEWDANLFALYAAIPFHMIDFDRGYTVHSIINEFNVSVELAKKRIDDIREKTYWEQKRQLETYKPVFRPFTLENCTDETKRIMRQLSKQTGVKYI
ncbi:ImmA/IrrE family metallo-endopeptidase [Sporolactobacillus sp. THM7-7]|nr:ImmA/IrrE family metallo-endopeptidase [Sporolactobacillus sp. THM7-7]